ncbi:MAG: hypothetical protein ACYTF1_07195 [Planctomycetota bacterium]
MATQKPPPWIIRHRTALMVASLFIGVSTVGLAATETGRNFIRWIFTPIKTSYEVEYRVKTESTEKDNNGNNLHEVTIYTQWRTEGPYTSKESEAAIDGFIESEEIKKAGGGRLLALFENPDQDGNYHISYFIEYTLSNGEIRKMSSSRPTGKQAKNMRIDEILQLRDSGAGEIISQSEYYKGLGLYTIRFSLPDSQTVDLETWYPPSTREEREAIFAETRSLKEQKRFSVHKAIARPDGQVFGVLHYKLADGRKVGIVEHEIPSDLVSSDGKYIVMPKTQETVEIEGAAGN